MRSLKIIIITIFTIITLTSIVYLQGDPTIKKTTKENYQSLVKYTLIETGREIDLEFIGKGDIAYKQITTTKVNYEKLGLKDIDSFEKKLKNDALKYKNISGIKYELKFNKTSFKRTLLIDYKKINIKDVINLDCLIIDGDPEDGIHLKKLKILLKDTGFTEITSK